MTHAGPTKRRAGIVSQALSGRSLPVIQWTGASKCVPVCSPNRSVFQYHAGPFVVVPRDDVDRDARRRGEDRRQADDRRRRPERLREIDDLSARRRASSSTSCVERRGGHDRRLREN